MCVCVCVCVCACILTRTILPTPIICPLFAGQLPLPPQQTSAGAGGAKFSILNTAFPALVWLKRCLFTLMAVSITSTLHQWTSDWALMN